MSKLFERITGFGYEIEYPIDVNGGNYDDYCEAFEGTYSHEYARYNIHNDGIAQEFATPLAYNYDDYLKGIAEVYDVIEYMIEGSEGRWEVIDDEFNGTRAGVHIRIDVTEWKTIEIARFMRLFSTEWSDYPDGRDYIDFIVDHVFKRSWHNWNSPFPYRDSYHRISDRSSTYSKAYNVQFESGRFDGRDTLEIRGFGVCEEHSDAVKQAESLHVLCAIVDRSFELLPRGRGEDVLNALYTAYREIVVGESRTDIGVDNE